MLPLLIIFGITEPVTSSNSDIVVNSGKKLHKGHTATLKMTSEAT